MEAFFTYLLHCTHKKLYKHTTVLNTILLTLPRVIAMAAHTTLVLIVSTNFLGTTHHGLVLTNFVAWISDASTGLL